MSLPTLAQILNANHNETAAIILIAVLLSALLVHACRRLRGGREEEEPPLARPRVKRPPFWRRLEARMDQAEPDARYGNLLARLQGWSMAMVPIAMLVAGWVIYAVVPDLSAPILYVAFVSIGGALAYYTFLPQPNLDVQLLLLHFATGMGVYVSAMGWPIAAVAIGFVMAVALVFFQASGSRRKKPAERWSRPPASTEQANQWKPEDRMALVGLGVQVVVGALLFYGAMPNIGFAAALPLVGVVPWLLNYLMERARSYQMPPLRSPWFLIPIAPVAWLLQVLCGLLLHLLMPSRAAARANQAPREPEPKGGLGGVMWFLAGHAALILLLCGGQFFLWQASQAVRAQAILASHIYFALAFVLHSLAAAPMALGGKSDPISHGLVAARAMARNLSVLSLLLLPILFVGIATGTWRQSVWPWAYLGVIVAGMVAMAMQKPSTPEPPPAETKAFRAAAGR